MILTLALALSLLGQTGTCKAGSTCRAYSFQPPCIATASLPVCSASVKGRSMCDGTLNCLAYCNGSAWACSATTLNSAGGWFNDGGSIASNSQTLRVEVGSGGFSTDGGIRITGGNFDFAGALNIQAGTPSILRGGLGSLRLDNSLGSIITYDSVSCIFDSTITCTVVVSSTSITATTYLRTIGVATGSLPTCNSALKGAIITDTTINKLKFCSGTAWETITSI